MQTVRRRLFTSLVTVVTLVSMLLGLIIPVPDLYVPAEPVSAQTDDETEDAVDDAASEADESSSDSSEDASDDGGDEQSETQTESSSEESTVSESETEPDVPADPEVETGGDNTTSEISTEPGEDPVGDGAAEATTEPEVVVDVTAEPEPEVEVTEAVTDDVSTSVDDVEATTEATTEVETTEAPDVTDTDEADDADEETPEIADIEERFEDDFEDGDSAGWSLGGDWQVTFEDGDTFLATDVAGAEAEIDGLDWDHLLLAAELRVDPGNTVEVTLRAGGDDYIVTLDAAGQATLLRDGEQLAAGEPIAVGDEAVWRTLRVQVLGDKVTVGVNEAVQFIYEGTNSTGDGGGVIFGAADDNSGEIAFDDVALNELELSSDVPVATPPPVIEVTAEATAEATTEAVAEATVEATVEATAEATVEATAEATLEATAEATPEVETVTEAVVVLSEDFEGEVSVVAFGGDANIAVETEENNVGLLMPFGALSPAETLVIADFTLNMDVNILSDDEGEDGATRGINVAFRTREDGTGYALTLDGATAVLSLVGAAGMTELVSADAGLDLGSWYALSLSAENDVFALSIDGETVLEYTATEAILSGQFSVSANAASSVMVDNIQVSELNAVAVAPTPAPIALSPEAEAKLAGSLANVLKTYLNGTNESALEQAEAYFMQIAEDRVRVILWTTEDASVDALVSVLETTGADINTVEEDSVDAHVTIDSLLALVNTPEVRKISLPTVVSSTSDAASDTPAAAEAGTGSVEPFSLDVIGVNDWYDSGARGDNAKVAVIDVGFFGVTATGERDCLVNAGVYYDGSTAFNDAGDARGTSTHGLDIVEVICDVAPEADVQMYRADSVATLADSINQAESDGNRVILIVIDLGAHTSPGDGTDGNDGSNVVYDNIAAARANGVLVIASAGNNANNYTTDPALDVDDRYLSFTVNDGSVGGVTIDITGTAGDVVNVSWNDWDSVPNSGGTRENFDISLSGGSITPISDNRSGTPGVQLTIPNEGDCSGGTCNLTLGFSKLTGNAPNHYFQVQTIGARMTGIGGSVTLDDDAGNLARPADSQDVLAVGAICPEQTERYPITQTSSTGPIFAAGGNANSVTAPFNRSEVKPDLVAPTHVSTENSGTATSGCFFNFIGGDSFPSSLDGLNGTSAAAAHAAGIAALLLGNDSNDSMLDAFADGSQQANELQDYMQAHTIDLYCTNVNIDACQSSQADGFDMLYGAGLTVLGSPFRDISDIVNNATIGSLTNAIYVGHANMDSTQDGSASNPFTSLAYALSCAADPDNSNSTDAICPGGLPSSVEYVVVQPTELVSSFDIDSSISSSTGVNGQNDFDIQSYDLAADGTLGDEESTFLWVNNVFAGAAAVSIRNSQNIGFEGFLFELAEPADLNHAAGYSLEIPQAFEINNAEDISFSYNDMSDYVQWSRVQSSDGVRVAYNSFRDFLSSQSTNGIAVLELIGSGSASKPTIIEFNEFNNNVAQLSEGYSFNAIVRVGDLNEGSEAKFAGNRFLGNRAQTMVLVNNTYPNRLQFNADPENGPEVQFFSNQFLNNNFNGPLVHLRWSGRSRFVNNAAVNNQSDLGKETQYGSVIVRGDIEMIGRDFEEQLWSWDIHNNLFFQNDTALGVGLLGSVGNPSLTDCDSVDDIGTVIVDKGFRNNYVYDSGSITLGPCNDAVSPVGFTPTVDPDQNGVEDSVGLTFDNGNYLAEDDTEAGAPVVDETPGAEGAAIDRGDNSALDGIAADYVASVDDLDDQLGSIRVFGGVASGTVDIGALEFAGGVADLEADPINVSINEDTPFVSFTLEAEGGYSPYSFSIPEGSAPLNFSTDTENECGGESFIFNEGANRVTYCPPADFFTVAADLPAGREGLLQADSVVTFTYQVEDLLTGASQQGPININIAPRPDSSPSSANYQVSGELNEDFTFRLRPYVLRFNNFSFGNSPGSNGVDYPFSYTYLSHTDPNGLFNDVATPINNADATGFVNLGEPNETNPGIVTINYRVTSSSPSGVTTTDHTVTLNVGVSVTRAGMYDDSSTAFDYDDVNWTAQYVRDAINDTLHFTKKDGAVVDFEFEGRAFQVYVRSGNEAKGAKWTLEVESTSPDDPTPTIRNLQQLVDDGRCPVLPDRTEVFNGELVILSKDLGDYIVGCGGFENDDTNVLRIFNRTDGKSKKFYLDAIEVLDTNIEVAPFAANALLPGFHEIDAINTAPIFTQEGTVDGTFKDGWEFVASSEEHSQFMQTIDGAPTIDQLQFRFQGSGFALGTAVAKDKKVTFADNYTICVDPDGDDPEVCQTFSNRSTNKFAKYGIYRPFFGFDDNTSSGHLVTIKDVSGGQFIFDSIVVFGDEIPNTLDFGNTFDDDRTAFVFGEPEEDTWVYNEGNTTTVREGIPDAGPFISFVIDGAADSFAWTREEDDELDSQSVRVCVDRARGEDNCLSLDTRGAANPLVINEADFGSAWGVETDHIVEIFSLEDEKLSFRSVDVLTSTDPLQPGYYEENIPAFQFDAGTTTKNKGKFSGGSAETITTDGDAMLFRMNGAGFTILSRRRSTAGQGQICYLQSSSADKATVLTTGECFTFDNVGDTIFQYGYTVLGLPTADYTVVVQHTTGSDVEVDAVVVHDESNWNSLTPFVPSGGRYESSYTNRNTANEFYYYGSWVTKPGDSFSNLDFDEITEIGSAFAFRMQNADAFAITRETKNGNRSDAQVCIVRESDDAFECITMPDSPVKIKSDPFVVTDDDLTTLDLSTSEIYSVVVTFTEQEKFKLDYVQVYDTSQDFGFGEHPNWDPRVEYPTGTWNLAKYSKTDGYAQTLDNAAQMQFVMFGSQFSIDMYLTAGTLADSVEVCYSNGTQVCETFPSSAVTTDGIQTFTPDPAALNTPLYGAPDTITVTLTNNTGAGTEFAIDKFAVFQSDTTTSPLPAGFYEEDYPGLFPNAYDPIGDWTASTSGKFSDGTALFASTDTASFTFQFTGTGFEIGTNKEGSDADQSLMQICFKPVPLGGGSEICQTYDNSTSSIKRGSRTVTGLTQGTWEVIVSNQVAGRNLVIDFVRVFDEPAPPTLTAGTYNEDAADATGTAYLQLLPAERWAQLDDSTYTNGTFATTINEEGVASGKYGGMVAGLNVEVPTGGVTLVLSTKRSDTGKDLLVCSGYEDIDTRVLSVTTEATLGANECAIVNALSTADQIVLELTNAGATETRFISLRTLFKGRFDIDHVTVINGTTQNTALDPGIYDDYLASSGGILSTTGDWKTKKQTAAFGESVAQSNDAEDQLSFRFNGTGFSVVTKLIGGGSVARICYRPLIGSGPFPPLTEALPYSDPSGVYCERVANDTNDWNRDGANVGRQNPGFDGEFIGYGFSYYGLNPDTYEVQVTKLVDDGKLRIDAVAIFGQPNTNTLLPGTIYDDRDEDIMYTPDVFWTQNTSSSGPAGGYYLQTVARSQYVGPIANFTIQGNSVIVYQRIHKKNTFEALFCLVEADGPACTSFRQYDLSKTAFSPILFFGFGDGTHEIILENRRHTQRIELDAIRVLP